MNKIFVISFYLFALTAYGQEQQVPADASATPSIAEEKPAASGDGNANGKKMVREANINLQTTVTGSQEQPRVMYILPWQSPLSPDLEMEMLSSQEDAVFGHVERDEMQRSLDAAGELDSTDQ